MKIYIRKKKLIIGESKSIFNNIIYQGNIVN